MSLSKKIFIISSVLLGIVLIFWGVYNLAFKESDDLAANAPANSKVSSETDVSAKKTSSAKIAAISDEGVLSPSISKDGGSLKYFSKTDHIFYQINSDGGGKQTLSPKTFSDVSSVLWSPDTSKIVLVFSQDGKKRFMHFDFAEDSETILNENIDAVAWQNNSKIIYKYYNTADKKATVNLADPDGKNWRPIAGTDFRYLSMAPVPKTTFVSFWNSAYGFAETKLETASALGADSKTLFSGKFGADYLWNQDSTKILVSHSNEKGGGKMQLATLNDKGGEYKNLEIPSFVSKCIWSKDNMTVYCALPGTIPESAVLPNDYDQGKFKTSDTFWKINTATGEKSRLIELDKINGNFDASNLLLTPDESALFFLNKHDEKIYSLYL